MTTTWSVVGSRRHAKWIDFMSLIYIFVSTRASHVTKRQFGQEEREEEASSTRSNTESNHQQATANKPLIVFFFPPPAATTNTSRCRQASMLAVLAGSSRCITSITRYGLHEGQLVSAADVEERRTTHLHRPPITSFSVFLNCCREIFSVGIMKYSMLPQPALCCSTAGGACCRSFPPPPPRRCCSGLKTVLQ